MKEVEEEEEKVRERECNLLKDQVGGVVKEEVPPPQNDGCKCQHLDWDH